MPLALPAIQKELEAALLSAFTREFAAEASADPTSYARQSKAIAEGVATILIKALLSDAVVAPPKIT